MTVAATAPQRPVPAERAFEAELAFLGRPGHYPDRTRSVQAVETHMSWVFLTDRHAYKVKKPVRNTDVDLRTLAARQWNCAEEVRLNRRLATDVYLGVVALRSDARGTLAFGDDGAVVDWLVKMRRLPAERMLDRLIAERRVAPADIEAVVARLCDFYRRCAPVGVLAPEYRRQFGEDVVANRAELARVEYGPPLDAIDAVCSRQLAAIAAHGDRLDARAHAGRIVEGHGDLRPEHVCVEPVPQVIDCLEFSRVLRTLDPADELGFLALECERLGAPELRAPILDGYRARSGDDPPDALVHFYQSHRACVRATLAIRHLREASLPDPDEWRRRARDYLALARDHVERCL